MTGCIAAWDPTWSYGPYPGDWWAEFKVAGGGVLTRAVWVELVGTGASSPLSYGYGRWAGGVPGLRQGTSIILHARDALGATAQTQPFRYLVDPSPRTDACRGTARTNTTCQPLARGLVTFTIDDSGGSQATVAVPLLRRYGVKATFYHVPPFLSWTSLARTLALEGHETGAHTMTHRSLTSLSPQQVDDELRLSKQALEADVSSPVESFASPSGAYNDAVIAAIKPYFRSHRTTVPGLNFVGSDVYELGTDFVLNDSTAAGVCAQMAEAAALRGWLVFTFHDFTTASSADQGFTVTSSLFEAVLSCATRTPGLDVVTTRQGVAAIRCPP